MTQHHDPHTCSTCGLCVCGCDDCGRIYCACLDCPCENRSDHTDSECAHLDGDQRAGANWFEDVAFIPRDFAEAVWKAAAPATPTNIPWDNIIALYKKMLPQRLQPTDPRGWTPYIDHTNPEQVRAAHAALEAYEDYMTRNQRNP